MEDVQEERGVKLRNGVKSTEHWYGRAHTDLAMIKNWTLTPPPPPSIPYLCTNIGRPHIQGSILELWYPVFVNSNQFLDTLQEHLFVKLLLLQPN